MDFIMRPKEESPIYQKFLRDGEFDRAAAYGAKVDEFCRTGVLTEVSLEYEGPDLSPGADRPNGMKGGVRAGFHANGERKAFGTPPMEDAGGLRGRTSVSPSSWRGRDREATTNT